MTAPFQDMVNDAVRETALQAVVEVWRDLRGKPGGDRVIEVYARSSASAVGDLVLLRQRIDAALAVQGAAT